MGNRLWSEVEKSFDILRENPKIDIPLSLLVILCLSVFAIYGPIPTWVGILLVTFGSFAIRVAIGKWLGHNAQKEQ